MAPKRQYAPAPFIVIVMMSQIFLFLNREKNASPFPGDFEILRALNGLLNVNPAFLPWGTLCLEVKGNIISSLIRGGTPMFRQSRAFARLEQGRPLSSLGGHCFGRH